MDPALTFHPDSAAIRYVDRLTRHIDVGLGGMDADMLSARIRRQTVEALSGAKPSAVIASPDQTVLDACANQRNGVLSSGDDTITDPLKGKPAAPGRQVFMGEIQSLRQKGPGLRHATV